MHDPKSEPIPQRTSFNLKKENLDQYRKEDKLIKRRRPTNCQKGEKILHTIILQAASQHIPSGRHRITELVPAEILERMRARDDLRSRDHTSPALQQMNDEITRTTNEHGDSSWRHWTTGQNLPRQLNISPHSSMTPSHYVESRRFGSHLLSSLSLNPLHIGQSRYSARQRTLWRFSYLPLSTHTCSQLLTNTDSDLHSQPLRLYYN